MQVNEKNTIQATQTSLDIIEEIRRLDGATLADLAERVGVARSTAHSHLNTLRKNGYVSKRGELYHLDFRFLFLGEYMKRRQDAYGLAEKYVRDIATDCDEYVDFSVEQNGRILTVHLAVDGIQNPQFDIAEYYPMTATAPGKAILGQLSDERVEEILEDRGLPERTANTITSEAELFEELERVRERGYAVSHQEWVEGLNAVAVPLTHVDGTLLGAFNISGPAYKMTDETIESDLLPLLVDAKTEFEAELDDPPFPSE